MFQGFKETGTLITLKKFLLYSLGYWYRGKFRRNLPCWIAGS